MTHCRIHEHMLASDAATGRRLVSGSLIVILGGGFSLDRDILLLGIDDLAFGYTASRMFGCELSSQSWERGHNVLIIGVLI